MTVSVSARPMRAPSRRPLSQPRTPGEGRGRLPREVGEPRPLKPRGPFSHPQMPQFKEVPNVPWWEWLLGVATPEIAAAAAFLGPMGIVADHYLDRKDELEKQPLFTPCGSEPHLREREVTHDRRLSDMERLRRSLRWYADEDHAKGKLLDRDIDALKILIADIKRQDEIREIQTQLNRLNPGSTEAQKLRQEISNLKSAHHLSVESSTAARAQVSGAAPAPDSVTTPTESERQSPTKPLTTITLQDVAQIFGRVYQKVDDQKLVYPYLRYVRFGSNLDPQSVPHIIQYAIGELLDPKPMTVELPEGNRELVALATLRFAVRSSSFEKLFKADDSEAQKQSVRDNVHALYPLLVQWIDTPLSNGRHFLAADTYLVLVSAGLLTLDPDIMQKIIPDSDHWTAANQRFVYRLLLNPDTPLAVAMDAVSKLRHVIMTDLWRVTPDTAAASIILILGGIEVLVKWNDLSGTEVHDIADAVRALIRSAAIEVQKHALQTYVQLVNSGYLSDADLRAGLADMDALAAREPLLEKSVRGALLVLGAWVPRDTLAYERIADAEIYLDGADTPSPIPLNVLRAPHISTPLVPKPSWSQVWQLVDHSPETRDPALSKAARVFGVPLYMLWSPLLDEARLAVQMSEKIEEISAYPTFDDEDRVYVEAQRDVVIDFLTSQRRRMLWLQLAQGHDTAAKHELVALLEQRMKVGGTANELTEIQQVRNVALGLPDLSFDGAEFERYYLKSLWNLTGRNARQPVKWGRALDIFINVKDLEIAYFTSVLTHGQFFRDIPRKLQQLAALRVLWGVGEDKPAGYYDVLYHAVAPLLELDDPDLAYAAAMTANQLQRRGAQEVDVEHVHALISASVWERLASGNYKDEPEDMLTGLEFLLQQGLVTDQQIDLVVGVVLQVLNRYNESAIQKAMVLYLDLLHSHEDATAKSVDTVADVIVKKTERVVTQQLRERYFDVLEQLAPYIPRKQKTYHGLRSLVFMHDLSSWVGRAVHVLQLIESNPQ